MNKLSIAILFLIIGIGITILFDSRSDTPEPTTTTVENIKCQIDSFTDSIDEADVPINVRAGAQATDDLETVEYRGFTAVVVYNTGDEYEPQTFLSMTILEEDTPVVYTTMYDYYPEKQVGPINVLHLDGGDEQLRLQCWID